MSEYLKPEILGRRQTAPLLACSEETPREEERPAARVAERPLLEGGTHNPERLCHVGVLMLEVVHGPLKNSPSILGLLSHGASGSFIISNLRDAREPPRRLWCDPVGHLDHNRNCLRGHSPETDVRDALHGRQVPKRTGWPSLLAAYTRATRPGKRTPGIPIGRPGTHGSSPESVVPRTWLSFRRCSSSERLSSS